MVQLRYMLIPVGRPCATLQQSTRQGYCFFCNLIAVKRTFIGNRRRPACSLRNKRPISWLSFAGFATILPNLYEPWSGGFERNRGQREQPLSIEIDTERKLSIVTLSGEFDLTVVKGLVEALGQHPDYEPTFNALYDLRNVTMGAITADQLQRLAFDVFDPGWNGTKFAMVADEDDVYGMARVYAAVADETGQQQRRAFRSFDAALTWLEQS